jgi:hypothetical protein
MPSGTLHLSRVSVYLALGNNFDTGVPDELLLYVGDVVEVCILDRMVVGTYLVSGQIVW